MYAAPPATVQGPRPPRASPRCRSRSEARSPPCSRAATGRVPLHAGHPKTAGLQRLQVSAAGDEADINAGPGQLPAEKAADPASPEHRDLHARSMASPGPPGGIAVMPAIVLTGLPALHAARCGSAGNLAAADPIA